MFVSDEGLQNSIYFRANCAAAFWDESIIHILDRGL